MLTGSAAASYTRLRLLLWLLRCKMWLLSSSSFGLDVNLRIDLDVGLRTNLARTVVRCLVIQPASRDLRNLSSLLFLVQGIHTHPHDVGSVPQKFFGKHFDLILHKDLVDDGERIFGVVQVASDDRQAVAIPNGPFSGKILRAVHIVEGDER